MQMVDRPSPVKRVIARIRKSGGACTGAMTVAFVSTLLMVRFPDKDGRTL
jgi:hypothetical protein